MRGIASISSALALSMVASTASAAAFVLDFSGVADPSGQTTVGGFYNGGTSGDGNSGTNYGVLFSSNAVVNNIDLGEPDAQPGVLMVGGPGNPVVIDVAAGFETGFAFNYASWTSATLKIYDGFGANGNLLADVVLPATWSNACCNWTPFGVAFAGVAHSVRLTDGGNYTAYDDLTFGGLRPGVGETAIPEPETWALMIGGLGIAGGELRRRRRRGAAAQTA